MFHCLCVLRQVQFLYAGKGAPRFLLKSLILKVGYKAEVGSYQLKLHFHSALHAKPLKALRKILEAVQHEIALARCSRKTNLLPRFENWKFTRLITELPAPGNELKRTKLDQGNLGCSSVVGMTFPLELKTSLVVFSLFCHSAIFS